MAAAVGVGRQVAVAHDDDGRELGRQAFQQRSQTLVLGFRAGVAGCPEGIEAAFISDADGVLVVVLAVCPHLPQWTPLVDLAVAGDIVVIADICPPSFQVVGLALTKRIRLRRARGAAMHHDQCNSSHNSKFKKRTRIFLFISN